MGAAKFVAQAKALEKKYGAQFKAPKLLLDMAKDDSTFYTRFGQGAVAKAA
jgi:3-hydroxyacyl-CoA dehydrogenase / enoyl-CoA hydratase / 3-hydroxybutyryl-CoA epimerase